MHSRAHRRRRLRQFGAEIGALKPEALDRLDADGTMDAYADMLGTPAGVLVPHALRS